MLVFRLPPTLSVLSPLIWGVFLSLYTLHDTKLSNNIHLNHFLGQESWRQRRVRRIVFVFPELQLNWNINWILILTFRLVLVINPQPARVGVWTKISLSGDLEPPASHQWGSHIKMYTNIIKHNSLEMASFWNSLTVFLEF